METMPHILWKNPIFSARVRYLLVGECLYSGWHTSKYCHMANYCEDFCCEQQNLTQIYAEWHLPAPSWAELGQPAPNLAKIWPKLTRFGSNLARFGPSWSWPSLQLSWPAQIWPKSGWFWAKSASNLLQPAPKVPQTSYYVMLHMTT